MTVPLAALVFWEADEGVELGRTLDTMTEAGEEDARWKVVAELGAPAWIPATPLTLLPEEADPALLLEP